MTGSRHSVPIATHAVCRRRLLPLLAVVVGACGLLPSEPPHFEEVYVVQAATLNLSAADLAPAEVSLNTDSSAFEIVSDSAVVAATLAQMCSACHPLHGTTAAKPAFTYTFSFDIPVSTALVAASITGGVFDLFVANVLTFDPLRPSATARGSIVMTVRRGSTTVASLTLDGTTVGFPQSNVLGGTVPMSAFNLNGPLTVDVTIDSPAGDAVTIDTTGGIVVFAGPVRASISEVTVSVASQSFADTVPLDFTETKLNLSEKLEGGAFRFSFTNPFAVGGSFSLEVLDAATGSTLLDKAITLVPAATSFNRIGLSKAEITSLLGKQLRVIISGSFDAPTGQLTLSPGQVATFTTLLELTVLPLGD